MPNHVLTADKVNQEGFNVFLKYFWNRDCPDVINWNERELSKLFKPSFPFVIKRPNMVDDLNLRTKIENWCNTKLTGKWIRQALRCTWDSELNDWVYNGFDGEYFLVYAFELEQDASYFALKW